MHEDADRVYELAYRMFRNWVKRHQDERSKSILDFIRPARAFLGLA